MLSVRGLTDYINQIFERLNRQPGIEVVNLVDTRGGARGLRDHIQIKEGVGVTFTLVELP